MKNVPIKFLIFICAVLFTSCSREDAAEFGSSQNGSYSTMLTIQNKLYLVNQTQIKTFDITNPSNPLLIQESDLGFNIESIYYYENLLLVGSREGMHILEIDQNGIPQKRSFSDYRNLRFCSTDPIVAAKNLAYVTLSSDEIIRCDGFALNELRVYDITNTESPVLLEQIDMSEPKGLGLYKSKLFVCDGKDGLVVFDNTNMKKPEKENTIGGFKAFDLIIRENKLIISCEDHLRQYDISDPNSISLVSIINL